MKVGCNLLWLVPGVVGGTEMATVSLLRELAAEPADGIEPELYALDVFGQRYPDLIEAFPTRLVQLTGSRPRTPGWPTRRGTTTSSTTWAACCLPPSGAGPS
jgi:hypothetical protein